MHYFNQILCLTYMVNLVHFFLTEFNGCLLEDYLNKRKDQLKLSLDMLYLKLSWGHGLSIFIGLQVDLLGLYMGYMKKRGQMAKSGRVVDSKAKYSPHLLLIVMLAAQQPSSLSRRRSINVESFQSCKHGKTESSQLGGLDQGAATTGSLLVL